MRAVRLLSIVSATIIAASVAWAQGTAPAKPPTPSGGTTTTGSPGSTPTTGLPSTNTPRTTSPDTLGGLTRGTLLTGRVVMQDGSVPPQPVVIERVCGGNPRPQGYTDPKGYFSFQIGDNSEMIGDASVSRISVNPIAGVGSNSASGSSMGGGSANRALFGCDLRAALPGYRSDMISLANHRNLDNPDVGTIVLHRMGNVEGLTTSATSLMAPKDAKKAYEKGLDAVKKSKIDEAQTNFLKATEIYPKYSEAWYELGRVYEQRDHAAEAQNAFSKAIAADPKFINPYEHVYILAFKEQKWQDVADNSDRVIHLNAYDFPGAYYYNAVANLQLDNLDPAEKSARQAVKLDTEKKNPRTNYLLGVILARKEDYKGAVESFKAYLASGDVPDKDKVQKMLATAEQNAQAKAEPKPDKDPQP